jgi:hypothetical protein
MSALTQFDPPGFLNDLDAGQREAWSHWISDELDAAREREDPALSNYGPRPQFFNPLKNPPTADGNEADITWTAFPRIVAINSISEPERWRRADASRDRQDEYCEWSVTRDLATGKILRVTFTSEGPEYWEFLASVNAKRVLELYRQHISPDVLREHLFPNGTYDARNMWNSSTSHGAMHLIQKNNTLLAEIELAAGASLVRAHPDGGLLTSEQELIECGKYGAAQRHSDPHIGGVVNEFARQKADVTLANPVGLCIEDLSVVGWATPDDSDPKSYWKITRGTETKALRAVYEVPREKPFTVSDVTINDQPITFGAQIADFITIKLTGLATRFGQSTVQRLDGCVEEVSIPSAAEVTPNVAAVLARSRRHASRRS